MLNTPTRCSWPDPVYRKVQKTNDPVSQTNSLETGREGKPLQTERFKRHIYLMQQWTMFDPDSNKSTVKSIYETISKM